MPILPSSPGDFTATVKSAAVANAAVGGASARPSKNSGGFVSLGALGAIVTQSALARATISQRFDPTLAPPPVAIVQSLTLNRTGTREVYVVKYNTNGSIQWARRINGQGDGVTFLYVGPKQGITTDALGNVYVIGTSPEAGVTIFGEDNTTTAFSLRHAGGGDTFVVKYDTLGTPLWARRLGGTTIHADQGNGIAVDPSGNVYVTGVFHNNGITMFAANDTNAAFTIASGSGFDGYVAKYNAAGTPQWLRRMASGGTDSTTSIVADSSGSVYICGYTTADFSLYNSLGNIAITGLRISTEDGYLAKYDTDGVPIWLRKLSRASVSANSLAIDSSGNVYLTGTYNNGGVFTAAGGTTSLTLPTSGESNNTYVVKYNTDGEPLWIRGLNGVNTNISYNIAVDTSNNVYITGVYEGPIVIRKSDNTIFLTTPAPGTRDVAIIKYSSDGTPQWFRRMGGIGSDAGNGISADASGNVYVTGVYSNTLTVFNGSGTTTATTAFTTLTSSGLEDIFLVKYDTTGLPLWAARIGGSGSDGGGPIDVDANGNVYSVGAYTSNPLTLRTTGF